MTSGMCCASPHAIADDPLQRVWWRSRFQARAFFVSGLPQSGGDAFGRLHLF